MSWSYIIIPFIVLATGAIGSYFGVGDVASWYTTINKPKWTPPGWVFGVVWTVLYALGATSALIVWNATPRGVLFWATMATFLVNAVLNAAWSYIFFRKHDFRWAYYEAIILEVTVLALILLIWPASPIAAEFLVPYFAWCLFAIVNARAVWRMNR